MTFRDAWPVRAVALATAVYSTSLVLRPQVLAIPCGLAGDEGDVPPAAASLIRSTGTRDAALAALLLIAPRGRQMRRLSLARGLCDAADAAWYARFVAPGQRIKVSGVAAAWALIEFTVDRTCNRHER